MIKMLKYILPLTIIAAILYFSHDAFALAFALTVAVLGWFGFMVWYALRSKWWRNEYGRNTMGITSAVVIMLCLILSRVLVGTYESYEVLWTYALLYLGLLGIHRTYLMEKAQREKN